MRRKKGKERRIDCYKSTQKILLVGEGDFSFSACLARAFRTASNIVATSYLDEAWLAHKHWTSVEHLAELERLGCLLLYNVDVYKMQNHPVLKNMKFDIIIFNFPHAGHYDYLCERDLPLIEMHKKLVGGYFMSASKMLSEGGEVHIRHRDDEPYSTWNVVLLADKAALKLKAKVHFQKSDFPGYHNKRGGNSNTNKTFPILCAFTFKFALDSPKIEEIRDCDHTGLLKKDLIKKNRVHQDDLDVEEHTKIDHDHVCAEMMNDVHHHLSEIDNLVLEMINDHDVYVLEMMMDDIDDL